MKNLDDILTAYTDGFISAGQAVAYAFKLYDEGNISEAIFDYVFSRLF